MRPLPPSPSESPLAIGARIRHARLSQGLTIADVAAAAGLTKGFISRIERDETSPSVVSLLALCQVLSIPVGALFQPPRNEVVTLAAAPLINMGGTRVVERLLTPRTEQRVQVLRSVMEPGASGGAEYYTINCDVETIHVLAGELTIRFPQRAVTLGRGDTMTVAGREPHTWVNESRQRSEVVWTIVPAAWSGSS